MVPAGVCVWSLVSGEMEMDSQIKSCSVASRGKVCVCACYKLLLCYGYDGSNES